jgi:hypothetical protein
MDRAGLVFGVTDFYSIRFEQKINTPAAARFRRLNAR